MYADTKGFNSYLRVARFHAENLDNPAAWEVIVKPPLKKIFGQVSVVWNNDLGKYVMVHAGSVFKEPRTIWIRLADDPAGPFSKPVKIFEKPGKIGDNFKGIF
ncbi:hypothetical protein KKF84_09390 [Myxococcota bacterium]|nr:hypothetical protein [Myxococcota bacterium]MBU1535523.1 hypothetical protein [Myxococcota bacterium]